jgi:hypothetical protein
VAESPSKTRREAKSEIFGNLIVLGTINRVSNVISNFTFHFYDRILTTLLPGGTNHECHERRAGLPTRA